jgi:hypothetical protein
VLSPGLLTHLTRAAVQAARGGDEELAAHTAGRIAEDGDALDLIAACRVVADTALRALLLLYGPPDAARGEVWALDDLGDAEGNPARLFAARLVTAYANADHDTVTALVAAAAGASPEERVESLRALVSFAAGLEARAAHDKNDRTEGTENR